MNVTAQDKAQHTMMHLVKQIGLELGYVGGDTDELLATIRGELADDLTALYYTLVDFYAHQQFVKRDQTGGAA